MSSRTSGWRSCWPSAPATPRPIFATPSPPPAVASGPARPGGDTPPPGAPAASAPPAWVAPPPPPPPPAKPAPLGPGSSFLAAPDSRLNPEHPPLVKMLAALPLLGMRVWPAGFRDAGDGTRAFAYLREAWAMSIANLAFSEWRVAQLFLYGLRDRLGVDPLDAPTTVS